MRSWSYIYHILHIYRYFYLYCFCQAKQGAIVLQTGDGKFWTNPKDSDTRIRHSFAATARSIIPFPESCFSFFLSESDPCNNVKVTYPNKKKMKWCMPIPCQPWRFHKTEFHTFQTFDTNFLIQSCKPSLLHTTTNLIWHDMLTGRS